MGILLTVLALVLFSCTKEENDVTPAVAQLWSEAAPHQPTAPDLREKINSNIINAGLRNNLAWLFLSLYRPSRSQEALLVDHYFKHADALTPVDNPSTTDFDESEVNTMNELVERLRQTGYSELPDLPAQPVPDWLARQYEFLTGIPMPNGPVADQTAIERAIAACNTFLDYRPEVRAFVQDYYGVAFP